MTGVRIELVAAIAVVLLCMAQHCIALPMSAQALDGEDLQDLEEPDIALGGARQTSRLSAELRKAELKLVPAALLEWPTREEYGGPADITSESQLRELGPFVAPILYGGLGNVLFQLAALIKHSKDTNLPLVIGCVWLEKSPGRRIG